MDQSQGSRRSNPSVESLARPARLAAVAAMVFFFATWLVGAVLFVNGIYKDLDVVLDLMFSGAWTPEAVRLAAEGWGVPASLPAWVWLGIESALVVSFGAVGLLLFRRKRDRFGTYLGVAFALIGTRIAGPVTYHLGTVWPALLLWMHLFSSLAYLAFASLLYIYPDGRFVPALGRWLIPPALALSAYGAVRSSLDEASSPSLLEVAMLLGFFAIGLGGQIYRYARLSGSVERQQTKWALASFALFLFVVVGVAVAYPNALQQTMPPTPQELAISTWLFVLLTGAMILFILALAVAILRYKLWGIDVIIRRTLVYGALTVTLGLVYFGSVVLLQRLSLIFSGQSDSPIAVVISTLGIAALFTPLRRRIQDDIDRRFYRQKYDASQTVEEFARRARDEVELGVLTGHLLDAVEKSMQPEHISLWLRKKK